MNIALILIAMAGSCVYAMENVPQTPDQVVLTIGNSDNPELDPLKVELTTLSNLLTPDFENIERDRKRDDDAPQGATQLVSASTPPTPHSTPAQSSGTRARRRPKALNTAIADLGIGIGSMSLEGFNHRSLSQDNSPDNNLVAPPPSPTFQKNIDAVQDSIGRLNTLSNDLLKTNSDLTQTEKRAVWSLYAATGTALGAGAGVLGWMASINPVRVYHESCSKFATGLELPALAAVGKAIIGPVAAIVAIGIAWHQFKKWIVDPYVEAHKAEIVKFQEAQAKHKAEIHAMLLKIEQHNEALVQEHEKDQKNTRDQLNAFENIHRQQLEHTLKEVTASETALKENILELSKRLKEALASTNNDINGLQNINEDMKNKLDQALASQQSTVTLVQEIKRGNERLLKLLKEKQLIVASPTSPASAPIKGNTLAVPSLSPHSAQVLGAQKKSWLSRTSKNSAAVAPLPPHLADESKHNAQEQIV